MLKSDRARARVALSAAVLLLATMFTIAALSTRDLVRASEDLSRTHEAVAALAATNAAVSGVESGSRGFVLTGRESYLEPYDAGIDESGRALARLRTLFAGLPERLADLDGLERQVKARVALANSDIAVRRARGIEAAREHLLDDGGVLAMQRIRRTIAEMTAREEMELLQRKATMRSSTRAAAAFAALCGALSLALLGAGWAWLHREISQRRRAVATYERRTSEIEALEQLGQYMQACTELEAAYEIAARSVERLCPGTSGALSIRCSDGERLETRGSWGAPGVVRSFTPGDCWAVRLGTPHLFDWRNNVPVCAHVTEPRPGAYTCRPMLAQGQSVGVLHVAWADARGPDSARLTSLSSAAEQIALALANLQLREELRRETLRDPLTGAHNRRFLDEELPRGIAGSQRRGRPLSIALIDADHFKRFNDQFGHAAGDRVLHALAQLLRERFRASDLVCRYGGEEFVVVLPDAGVEDAVAIAEDVRLAARAMALSTGGRELPPVTVSIGVASYPANAVTAASLLRAADTALYTAKAEGRDRVVVAAAAEAALQPA